MNDETSWSMIRGAAGGDGAARSQFARRYVAVVRAYLAARWRTSPLIGEVDDAVQEVFVDCFKDGGVLGRADPDHGGFRAFLFGVARNVALRVEERRARRSDEGLDAARIEAREESLSRFFDRQWARAVLREVGEEQRARAAESGEAALRRVELLRLRFEEELPIRDIARLWGEDADRLHHEYAQARQEYREALRVVLGLHAKCSAERVESECQRLLSLLRAGSPPRATAGEGTDDPGHAETWRETES